MHVLDSACNLKEFQKLTLKNCLNYFYRYFDTEYQSFLRREGSEKMVIFFVCIGL